MKKNVRTNVIYTEVAKKLGLATEIVQSSRTKKSLLISSDETFCLVGVGHPGFYPAARRGVGHFSASKLLTQKILARYGYNVIQTKEIRIGDFSSAKALATHIRTTGHTFPVLTKPDQGYDGIGIPIAENSAQLTKVGRKYYQDKDDFLVQPILDQPEYRILVVGNEVMFIHSKHNQGVTGDGKSTITQLLAKVKDSTKDTAFIAWQHKKLGTKSSTVLEAGTLFEYHLIKIPSAVYYKTKNFPPALKKWALGVSKTLSTNVVGIDVFIPGDFADTDSYTIIELNTNPALYYLPKRCNDDVIAFTVVEKILRSYFKLK